MQCNEIFQTVKVAFLTEYKTDGEKNKEKTKGTHIIPTSKIAQVVPIIVGVLGIVSQILAKNRWKIEEQLILQMEEIPEENA